VQYRRSWYLELEQGERGEIVVSEMLIRVRSEFNLLLRSQVECQGGLSPVCITHRFYHFVSHL
jgi:hypothetical protein